MTTPMNSKEKLCKEDGTEKIDQAYFRSLIGCLMYLRATRLAILNDVSILSQFMHCASEVHIKTAKMVLRYVKDYCFTLGYGIFSWSSKKQETMAQSTAEAEFVAATAVVNQVIWLRKILSDLHLEHKEDTKIFIDNQVSIAISHNPVFHGKSSISISNCFS
ncbi:hypothetical protein KIW84_054417 [Lathyrus oleraceus]|uniref:Uncharacterized protein n=1 Tax=Pisum sativum TaxID=3888 RepID=A0A9D5AHE9_PEA|nr:hypothetical protein KIW84_054417 [Pisum sativum]